MAIAAPVRAEVPLAWARVQAKKNLVALISTTGESRPATAADCLCSGERITTGPLAKAEVIFNDGSLSRLGERANLQFVPQTRRLLLNQGTAALFVPPGQGRTTVETPNATVGFNSTGVVVRYVPSRQLTLVMALANSASGPVSLTVDATGQEVALYGGQMALLSGSSLQVIEFDLLEFYTTSNLLANLQLANPNYRPAAEDADALTALRPDLLRAIAQQTPFDDTSAVIDPTLIGPTVAPPAFQSTLDTPIEPLDPLQRITTTPLGVIMLLAEPLMDPTPTNPASP